MTDDALARAKRALQLVPRQTGAVAPVDKAKVNDLIARAREAANKPNVPATVAPRKTVTPIAPARPIEKARELVPAQRSPASSPEPARQDRQAEPPPAVPVQPASPQSAPAPGPQTVIVQVPVPMPWWGYWGPGGWWVGCVSDCPLLRGKRRCRRCGL